MSTDTSPPSFEGWAIVELMGHRRLAGKLSEATIAGSGVLRIDVFVPNRAEPIATQFYSPKALYCVTPTTEEIACLFAESNMPEPVTRWELPEAQNAADDGHDPADDEADGIRLSDRD